MNSDGALGSYQISLIYFARFSSVTFYQVSVRKKFQVLTLNLKKKKMINSIQSEDQTYAHTEAFLFRFRKDE